MQSTIRAEHPDRRQAVKKAWKVLGSALVWLVTAFAVGIMVFTVVSATVFDRNDRSIFGYRMMIVLSDSMSATDFKAGDLILVKKDVDPQSLEAGDIISYISQDPANYGETVTHKIRRTATDEAGNPGFVTYGTTTGIDDGTVVTEQFILGQYRARIPGVGRFFAFLKTWPGYLLFVFLPFALLIAYQGVNCVRRFKEYRKEEMAEIRAERESLKAEREANRLMLEELEGLRAQLAEENKEKGAWTESEQNG